MAQELAADHHPDCYPSTRLAALDYFGAALNQASAKQAKKKREQPGGDLVGVIAPHIDFRVGLDAHAAAFLPLVGLPLAERYLILGVGHRSMLEWNLDRRDYVTPLGRVVCDREAVAALAPGRNFFSADAHEGEHSIEFPLVFLQAIHALAPAPREVNFIPVLCGGLHDYIAGVRDWDDLDDFHALAAALRRLFAQHPPGERLRVIVSIDGCHMGPRFRHPFPVTPDLLKATEMWEQELWAVVAKGNAREFLEWMREEGNDRYFDGVGALALLLAAGAFHVHRTYYEQWFTARDASTVTFSSGWIGRGE